MNFEYTGEEKFLSLEFVIRKEDLVDWLTLDHWEAIKDCFRTPIVELLSNLTEHVVGFVRTLYVDPQDEFISFEALFWPAFSRKTKEEWNNIAITGISFYDQDIDGRKVVSCFSI